MVFRNWGSSLKKSGVTAWGAPATKQIDGGIVTVDGEGYYSVQAETGTSDALDRINGLAEGDIVVLKPHTGHTITVTKGTYLKMDANFVLDNVYDRMTLQCIGSDICVECGGRSSNS